MGRWTWATLVLGWRRSCGPCVRRTTARITTAPQGATWLPAVFTGNVQHLVVQSSILMQTFRVLRLRIKGGAHIISICAPALLRNWTKRLHESSLAAEGEC